MWSACCLRPRDPMLFVFAQKRLPSHPGGAPLVTMIWSTWLASQSQEPDLGWMTPQLAVALMFLALEKRLRRQGPGLICARGA